MEYCKDIYKLPSINIDVVMDCYDWASIKDGVRNIRAKKMTKVKKKYKHRAVPKVISAEVPLPQGGDFKSFLGISENKIWFQLLLGNALIQHAPHDKTNLVSGSFEDPLEVRSSSPNHDVQAFASDHVEADTRMILSVIHSQANHIIVESQDTDVFVVLVARYKQFDKKMCI